MGSEVSARVVKHRPWGGIGWERAARTIMRMRASGATEAAIDLEQASLEWASSFGRMWRYIGQHEIERQCKITREIVQELIDEGS